MSGVYEARGPVAPYSPGEPPQTIGGPDCAALMRLATMGAIVGASASAAQQIRRAQAGTQTPTAALAQTGKAAVTAGVATAAAGAVASSVAEQGATRLGLMFLIGTAVVYGLQSRLGSEVDHE